MESQYVYGDLSFLKCDKRHSKDQGCNANIINMCIYSLIYTCEKHFSKPQSMNLALALQVDL